VLEGFQFLDSGNRGEAGADGQRSRPAAAPAAAAAPESTAAEAPEPEQDDVPF
jgi:hypothetical protein